MNEEGHSGCLGVYARGGRERTICNLAQAVNGDEFVWAFNLLAVTQTGSEFFTESYELG